MGSELHPLILPLAAYLLLVNLITFIRFWWDKRLARIGVSRVPEAELHFWELIGGSPASLVARQVFRHKSSKAGFYLISWGILVLQVVAVGVLMWMLWET